MVGGIRTIRVLNGPQYQVKVVADRISFSWPHGDVLVLLGLSSVRTILTPRERLIQGIINSPIFTAFLEMPGFIYLP